MSAPLLVARREARRGVVSTSSGAPGDERERALVAGDLYAEDERPPERCKGGRCGEIRHWLEVFVKRFFANQFKRSALPNGPKVSAGGTMSPRGDWRMPSDAAPTAWLADLERVPRS